MKKTVVIVMSLLLAWASPGPGETLQIDGSTTVGPIADAFAEYFTKTYPSLLPVNSGHRIEHRMQKSEIRLWGNRIQKKILDTRCSIGEVKIK